MSFGVWNLFPSTQNQVRIPAFVGMKSYQIPQIKAHEVAWIFPWVCFIFLGDLPFPHLKKPSALKISGFRGYLLYVTRAQSKTERQLELKVPTPICVWHQKNGVNVNPFSKTRLISVETTWRLGCENLLGWSANELRQKTGQWGGGWCAEHCWRALVGYICLLSSRRELNPITIRRSKESLSANELWSWKLNKCHYIDMRMNIYIYTPLKINDWNIIHHGCLVQIIFLSK